MNTRISLQDKVVGTAFGVGSSLINGTLNATDYLGLTQHEHLRLRWQLGRLPSGAITQWVTYEGNASSGRTPNKYPERAVLQLNKAVAEAMPTHYEGTLAVAYALGKTAMMVGTSKTKLIFQPALENAEMVNAAVRIGPGEARFTVGVLTKFGSFIDMSNHLLAGPQMLAAELPSHIPVV